MLHKKEDLARTVYLQPFLIDTFIYRMEQFKHRINFNAQIVRIFLVWIHRLGPGDEPSRNISRHTRFSEKILIKQLLYLIKIFFLALRKRSN